jgi:predicted kinase
MSVVYLVRGVPGSGKSTLAAKLADGTPGAQHYEADMYFEQAGYYKFVPEHLPRAHAWCFDKFAQAVRRSQPVIVSNTFTQYWEIKNYMNFALDYGAKVIVVYCQGKWDNVHNVPSEKVEQMRSRFASNEELAGHYPEEVAAGQLVIKTYSGK